MAKSILKKTDLTMLEENKEDFKDSVIERKNLINTFKISDVEKHLRELKKVRKEGESQMKLSTAMAANVLKNNLFIAKLSPEEQNAVFMYKENNDTAKEIEPQLKKVIEEIEKNEEYLDIIYDKFGFVKSAPEMEVVEGFVPKPKEDGESED